MKITGVFGYKRGCASTLIRLGTKLLINQPIEYKYTPSHTAILIDDTWIIESTFLTGVHIMPYTKWKESYTELYQVVIKEPAEHPLDVALEMWGKPYDFLALLYFLFKLIFTKLCKTPMPAFNPFESDNKFFCVEVVGRVAGITNYSLMTPLELFKKLEEEKYGKMD